jgi:hypothetical protein
MTSKRVRKDYKEEEEGDEQGINEGQDTLPPPTKKAKKGEKRVRGMCFLSENHIFLKIHFEFLLLVPKLIAPNNRHRR